MSESAFFAAVRDRDAETVRSLATPDPSLLAARTDEGPEKSLTAFHLAALLGDADMERLLAELGADVNARNHENRTALHVALEHNNTTRDVLIELGCVVDVCVAACLGPHDRLRTLLDDDPSLANDQSTGLSPLGWSSYHGAVDSARLLLDRGANPNDGSILCAAQVNCWTIGRMLIEAGVDPNAVDEECEGNALHMAACLRHTRDATPFVHMLLELGADVNARTPYGLTALDIAERHRERRRQDGTLEHHDYDSLIRLLEERGGVRGEG